VQTDWVTTTPRQEGADDFDLEAARMQIDQIDGAICDLIDQRRTMSRSIQEARMRLGDSRISHGRENQVIGAYGDRLGKPGVAISLAILDICRGKAPKAG
jgi:chorismate mutase